MPRWGVHLSLSFIVVRGPMRRHTVELYVLGLMCSGILLGRLSVACSRNFLCFAPTHGGRCYLQRLCACQWDERPVHNLMWQTVILSPGVV